MTGILPNPAATIWCRAVARLLVCLTLVLAFSSAPSRAESLDAARLTDATGSLYLSPYTLIQKDPARKVTPETIKATGGTILNGKLSKSDHNVFLGYDGAPTWLTIKLVNDSAKKDWYLDLGRRLDGRLGYLKTVRVYQMTLPRAGEPLKLAELPPQTSRGIYRVSLDQNSQSFVLMDVSGAAGISTILPVRLFAEKTFFTMLQSRETVKTNFCLALGGFALFFLMQAATRRRFDLILYGAYFIYAAILWLVYDYLGSTSGPGIFDELLVIMVLGYSLFSILLVKLFCGIDHSSYTEKYIVYGLAWLNAMSTLLIFFLPSGSGTVHASLLYGAPILTLAILSAMSYAQAKNGQIPGYAFCVSWLMPLLGMAATVLGACQLWPENFALLNAFWYTLFFQGLFLSLAVHQKLNREAPPESVFLNALHLQEAKNSADHAQLLKVIEKEREILSEFRQQESLRVEEMRRAKEAADEANRAKSAFLAVVSHEIRTPMTGIMGMVRLLTESSLSKQQKDYVMTIQESADAMLALLNDILDFEKIQRGKLELESISFDLHRLIQGVVNLMSGHAAQKGIGLSARMDDDIPRYVRGDPTRLRQVLLNLMGNAIKFTTAGGVTLFVKSLDQKTDADGHKSAFTDLHMIYFGIQDTGIGIPPSAQKDLFTPFTQVDSTVTRKFGGTGLGLAISKGLIDAMGSAININSQPGEGSTFFFTLAMRRGSAPTMDARKTPAMQDAPVDAKPLKILVVDDNPVNCKVVTTFLERDRHDITCVHSANAALEKIQSSSFDIVLMDIELPGMSGNEATRLLRDHPNPEKARIPVIAMTGNVGRENMEKYLSDGMNGFIGKPIDPDRLREIVLEISAKTFEREIIAPGGGLATAKRKDDAPENGLSLQTMALTFELEDKTDGKSAEGNTGNVPSLSEPLLKDNEHHAPEPPQSDHPVEDEVFSPAVLSSLKDTLGDAQLKSLLDELIAKTNELVGAMVDSSANDDTAALTARAHELKGMTGNFGLTEISDIALRTEKLLKTEQSADGLKDLVGTLPAASLRAQDALRRWLSS